MKRLFFATLLLNSVLIYSQKTGGVFGGAGHFFVGSTYINFNSLNNYLKSNQLPAFSSNCLNMGGGGFGVIDDFVIGGEGGVVSASKVANVNGNADISAAYGMFSCGYVLPIRSKLIVYPMTGLAWGGSGLIINYANKKPKTMARQKCL